ncbi:hypothetical protein D0B54_02370 [Solimonas sp. K1W22B-7]|uniref:hypothetical protein n=1 Tax=Solimonas sp. K1W22B-7 TaxID=2303331 RepID=UPI000E333DA5|nr:hypothetical protein [Solimonas sp. K1W22B-7]AXQ27586.1 hypothetical protein D0B54_02370 [Solimonas sp. K1W22B-7]
MPITSDNIKLYKTQVMSDTPDGGGRMTRNEVIDAELNNVFDDTSRDDRVNGRVSLRKVFGAVSTSGTDKYLGAHAVLTDPPADGRVVCTLFTLPDHASRRSDARTLIEQYLIPGAATVLVLYDTQPQGARTVVAYQALEESPPEVSSVLCLSVELAGHVHYGRQQFVRITGITSQTVTLGVNNDKWQKRLLTLNISEPLEISYPGGDFKKEPTLTDRPTRVRRADLNPAANFYGVVPLAEDVESGDTVVRVSTILQNIAPASYSETAILDQQVGSDGPLLISAGPEFTESQTVTVSGGSAALRLMRSAQMGSLEVTVGSGTNQAIFEETGEGALQRIGGGVNTAGASGRIDSGSGELSFSGLANGSQTFTLSYVPAALVTDAQHTQGTQITLANRGFNYSFSLIPKPANGAVMVSYRALGQWYTLTDNGKGQLVGAPGTGTGTVNPITGTVNATLGYQPDVGSWVLCGWRSMAHYKDQSGAVIDVLGAIQLTTAQQPRPGTLSIGWTYGGTTYSVTDSGNGDLGGHGSGRVQYWARQIQLRPSVLPPKGTVITVSYEDAQHETYTPSPQPAPSGGNITITLPEAPVEPGSVYVMATFSSGAAGYHPGHYDAGNGNLHRSDGAVGTINYTTGQVVFPATAAEPFYVWNPTTGEWDLSSISRSFSSVSVQYQTNAAGSMLSEPTTLNQLAIDVTPAIIDRVIGGSLLFSLNGRHYYDQGVKLQYRGAGNVDTDAGSFDGITGAGTITEWLPGSYTVALKGLLTRYGRWTTSSAIWRVPASPLRTGSFQVTNGTQTAIADGSGAFSTGSITGMINGTIDIETGVYKVHASPAIDPEILRYNAVALAYLPTDPLLLGLNPVRLPLDGRVPVLAAGRMLVIHHTDTEDLPNPPVAGSTYLLSRPDLAYAIVHDADGTRIPSDRYSVDLDEGEVTMANPLNLTGYTLPLRVEHRIEDMVRCEDAQLSGHVEISGDIVHDYPAGSFVSSALRFGDLQARCSEPFDQAAWTGDWSDDQIGSEGPGEYNALEHPIEVTNEGTISERWRIEFTSVIAFRLVGETVGVIATGNTSTDFLPLMPGLAPGAPPLLTLRAAGWGAGWIAGNQLRFNTVAAAAPIWINRCTLQGPVEEPEDSVRLQFRGDNQ